MSVRRFRILFVSHSASRNGATILLLSFLRWLRARVDWDIEILIDGGGELLEEFRSVAKTTVWRNPGARLAALSPRALPTFRDRAVAIVAGLQFPRGRFDLVYANTTAAAPMIGLLGDRASVVLWHVHELRYAMAVTLAQPACLQLFRAASCHVAVSEAVRATLEDDHAIDPAQIELVHGFVEPCVLTAEESRARRSAIRARHGIHENAFVVGACGSLGWRKGSDVFLQIADLLARSPSGADFDFLWVGGSSGETPVLEFEHGIRSFGLQHRCRLVSAPADSLDYYHAMDVFALTSREDPFPLVVLEAADRALPVICFDGAGGASEFVADGAGIRVPYLDTSEFAKQVAALRANAHLAARLVACARRKVDESHRVDRQGLLLLEAMQQCLLVESDRQSARTWPNAASRRPLRPF